MYFPPTVADPAEVRRVSARVARFDAQKILWRESTLQRVAFCGRFAYDNDAGISVKASGSVVDGTRRAGFGGLQTCGSTWACPVCSAVIAAERQGEIAAGINAWEAGGGSVIFGTLTMRHNKGHSLNALWDAVSEAWNRTTSGAGVPWNGGSNELGDKARFGIAGILRLVEVKHGVHGWHVHIHFLAFVRVPLTVQQLEDLRSRLYGRWEAALARRGFSVVEGVGIDLRPTVGTKLGDYFTKSTYVGVRTVTAAAAAYEVTGSGTKQAGKGGRSPFDILRDVVSIGLLDDLELWTEWEKGSKGRRQLTWTRGLRDLLRLDVERTDAELVDEDHGGDVLEWLHADWRDLRLAHHRAHLLGLAEADDTGEALVTWLNQRQAAFADGAPPGPRRTVGRPWTGVREGRRRGASRLRRDGGL